MPRLSWTRLEQTCKRLQMLWMNIRKKWDDSWKRKSFSGRRQTLHGQKSYPWALFPAMNLRNTCRSNLGRAWSFLYAFNLFCLVLPFITPFLRVVTDRKTFESMLKTVQAKLRGYQHVNKKAADQYTDYDDQVCTAKLVYSFVSLRFCLENAAHILACACKRNRRLKASDWQANWGMLPLYRDTHVLRFCKQLCI